MRELYAGLRRRWAGRSRWYPSVDEIAQLAPPALVALRASTSARIEKSVLTLLALGTFCIVTLESPDSLLLLESPSIRLPFVQNEVSFAGFLLVGPLLLLGIWTYLHILMTHRRLELAAMRRLTLPRSPDLSEARHPFLKAVAVLAYLVLVPLVMLDFAYKSAAVAGYGVWMTLAALLVGWIHLVAAGRMMRSGRPRALVNGVGSAIAIVLLAQCWAARDAIVRPFDLYRADLAGAFLPNANLRGAYAARANLEGAILIEADLTGAHLGSAKLAGADLSRATVADAYLGWTDLKGADLTAADFRRSRFIQADLRDANMASTNLEGTYLSGVNADNAILDLARLDGATIENSSFRGARLQQTSLAGVQDRNVNLAGPSLSPDKGVALSPEQQEQIAPPTEVTPIYGTDGRIISDGQERVFSPEELDKFFAPVESGQPPPTGLPLPEAPSPEAPQDTAPTP